MSRKHFLALAAALAAVRPTLEGARSQEAYQAAFGAWLSAMRSVADACKDSNPDFSYKLFYDACGY